MHAQWAPRVNRRGLSGGWTAGSGGGCVDAFGEGEGYCEDYVKEKA